MEPTEQDQQATQETKGFAFSRQALDHMRRPHNFGPPQRYDGHGCVTGPCGDTMNFWIRVERQRIVQVNYTTDGCVSSVASGSMCASLAEGHELSDAKTITQDTILEALGGMPESDQHCSLLAANTLMAAVRDYFVRRPQQSWMRIYQ